MAALVPAERSGWPLTVSQRSVVWVLLAASVLGGVYLASPKVIREWLPVFVSGAATLSALRVTRLRPRPIVAMWYAVAATMAGFTMLWALYAISAPAELCSAVIAASYLPAAYAVWTVAPRGRPERRSMYFDVPVIVVAVAVVDWQLYLQPYFDGSAVHGGLAGVVEPTVSLVLVPAIIRSLLSGSRMIAAYSILVLAAIASLLGGLILGYVALRTPGRPAVFGNLLAFVSAFLVLAAALHPDSVLIGRAHSRKRRPGAQTLWLAPVGMTLVALPWISAELGLRSNVAIVALAGVAMLGLVVVRCALLAAGADRLATTDILTGLGSRRAFSALLSEAAQHPDGVAVLAVDLDDFKQVNDSGGHTAGDELLVLVGRKLRAVLAPEDFPARLGGDEFAVLLFSAKDAEAALAAGHRVAEALNYTFRSGAMVTPATASVGVVPALPGESAEYLLTAADTAMYRAKRSGRGQVQPYSEALDRRVRSDRALAGEFAAVLADERCPGLEMHYQPVLELQSGRVHAAESLLRWHHPRLGLLQAGSFLHLIDTPTQARELDEFVLCAVLAQMCRWRASSGAIAGLAVGVNLSTRTLLRPDLTDLVLSKLAESGVPADQLILEITEHEAIPENRQVENALTSLEAEGIRLWLDDFGIAYTSLHYLDRFPISTLKFDKSVVDAGTCETSSPLLGALVAMGRSAGVATLAEGVASAEQAQRLDALGFELGQGYYLARPMSATSLNTWIARVSAAAPSTYRRALSAASD